jgi:hypothetical protein
MSLNCLYLIQKTLKKDVDRACQANQDKNFHPQETQEII